MGPNTKSQQPKFLFLLSLVLITSTTFSSSSAAATTPPDLTNLVFKGCANQKFQDGSYAQTLQTLFSTLISQSSSAGFYKSSSGQDPATSVTGLFQCRGDLSSADCGTCVKAIPNMVQGLCGGWTIAARVQLGGCYLRYEVAGFRQVSGTEELFKSCGSTKASGAGFEERLDAALGEVVKGVGVSSNGFYAGGSESLYVLGQCEGDLKGGDCVDCIKTAKQSVETECNGAISGHIYLQMCYLSYTYYPNGVSGSSPSGIGKLTTPGHYNTQKTVAIVVGGVVGLGLMIACLMVLKSAFTRKKDKYGGY